MNNIKLILLTFILVFYSASCTLSSDEKQKADKRLEQIKILINSDKLSDAKAQIDSIHALFPKLVDKRKMAVALKDTIILRESYKTVRNCEKALPSMKINYEKLLANFVFEKNEKYSETGKYVYKTQLTEQNTAINYLKLEIDETGDVFLISNYSGSKINHHSIKVEASGLSATTVEQGVFHAFNDGETYYENLTFKNDADAGVAALIANNKDASVLVTLVGNRNFSYNLGSNHSRAVLACYEFAKAKKAIRKAENDLRIAQQRIGKIKLLYN